MKTYVKRNNVYYELVEVCGEDICVIEKLPYANEGIKSIKCWMTIHDLDKE